MSTARQHHQAGVLRSVRLGRTAARRTLRLGWWLMAAGLAVDLLWHDAFHEIDSVGDQLQAHALSWLGSLVAFGGALAAFRIGVRGVALWAVLVSSGLFIPVSVWHFFEHLSATDAPLIHAVLAVLWTGILAGVPIATRGRGLRATREEERR